MKITIDFDPVTHTVTNIDCGLLVARAAVGILGMALEEIKFIANTARVKQMQLAEMQRVQAGIHAQQKAQQISKIVEGR